MSKFPRSVALAAALSAMGAAGPGPAIAGGGMGDCAARMRYMQEICEMQKRGEYPRYHNACRSDEQPKPSQR